MYTGLKNIQNLFPECKSRLVHSDHIHCLTGWTKLIEAPMPYASHQLYVAVNGENISNLPYTEDMHILCLTDKETETSEIEKSFPEFVSLLIVQIQPQKAFKILQEYFNAQCGIGMFGQTLLDFLYTGSDISQVIEYSYNVFQNPVFLFDSGYKLIAATRQAIEKFDIHADFLENQTLDDDEFRMINRDNIHSRVKKSDIPIRAYNEELGYEQLYCEISTKQELGHLVVSAVNKPLEDIDSQFLLILKKYVAQQLGKDAFIRNSRGFNYEYFLKDILDEKIVSSPSQPHRMDYVKKEFSGNMFCLVIETARSADLIHPQHIQNIFESSFPGAKSIIYNGQVIIIISVNTHDFLPEEYLSEIRRLCRENGIFSGLSNGFENIFKLKGYYTQALRAIEAGTSYKNKPALFCYRDYFLDHVRSVFKKDEDVDTFCHPKMKLLLDYDKEHGSEMAYTVYMYLAHERNLAAAAEHMHMHRSSLVYRFKKINELLNDSFDDYNDRMYMMLSYEMHR